MSDFIIGEVCLLLSLQSPSKNLPKQLASTCFFPWLPQLAQSQTWRQQAASVKNKDKASLSACSDVEPSVRFISPAPGWRITSHSLLFYFFFFLTLLCLDFYSTSPIKIPIHTPEVCTHPFLILWGCFLGCQSSLCCFFTEQKGTETGNSFL